MEQNIDVQSKPIKFLLKEFGQDVFTQIEPKKVEEEVQKSAPRKEPPQSGSP